MPGPPFVLAVVGGDRRQAAAARILAGEGIVTRCAALPGLAVTDPHVALEDADAWLLPPAPIGPDGIVPGGREGGATRVTFEALMRLRPGALVLSGALHESVRRLCELAGLRTVNYAQDESFVAENALLTAEGTIVQLIAERGVAMRETRLVVLGYGRCGRAIARAAADWDAEVTVVARSPAARWEARETGLAAHGFERLGEILPRADAVVNTVPAPVLGEDVLARATPGTYILDIASRPGGVDWAVARRRGLRGELLGGLPGLHLHESAGRAVARRVLAILSELGHTVPGGRMPTSETTGGVE